MAENRDQGQENGKHRLEEGQESSNEQELFTREELDDIERDMKKIAIEKYGLDEETATRWSKWFEPLVKRQ